MALKTMEESLHAGNLRTHPGGTYYLHASGRRRTRTGPESPILAVSAQLLPQATDPAFLRLANPEIRADTWSSGRESSPKFTGEYQI